MEGKHGCSWTVAGIAALLLVGMAWSAAPAVRDAVVYGAPRLLEIFAAVGAVVAISATGLVVALRRQQTAFEWPGVALLIVFGASSAAAGTSPGALFDSPAAALAFAVTLAIIAGVAAAWRSRELGWSVAFGTLFAGAATAAFMVGWAPVIARLLI